MIDKIDLLEGLLRIYSPSYEESAAVDYLVAGMKSMGMGAFRDAAGNAVGIVEPPVSHITRVGIDEGPQNPSSPPLAKGGRGGVRDIVLLGHIDTAPGVVEVRRTVETNLGSSHSGNGVSSVLFGRGAVDAKGPLCAFASAAALVGPREGWRIVVIGAVEEECPTSRGAHFAKTQYNPEFAIIGEPSGWDRVTLGYKGSLWVISTHKRSMAHSAGQNKSAAEEAVEFWLAIKGYAEDFNRDKSRLFDKLDPTLREMASESDGLQEFAKLTIGLRLPMGIGVPELEERILGMAEGGKVQFSTEVPAFRAEKNNPLVRAFLASIRAAGGEPGFTLKTGTSDMNILGPYWRCPIVTFGPGDSKLDHTPEEHIDIDEYGRSISVLALVLKTLTEQPHV
jgi:[amino group carrier protein]-lysine/ornithine hydrolase